MSDNYIQSKFEAFIKEANRLGLYGIFLSEHRFKDWTSRVFVFLSEIAIESTAKEFWEAGVDDAPIFSPEFNEKRRFLSSIYESYQIQKNLGMEPQNKSENPRQSDLVEKQDKSDRDKESSEKKELNVFIVHGHQYLRQK